jgi:hypothetical protein
LRGITRAPESGLVAPLVVTRDVDQERTTGLRAQCSSGEGRAAACPGLGEQSSTVSDPGPAMVASGRVSVTSRMRPGPRTGGSGCNRLFNAKTHSSRGRAGQRRLSCRTDLI